jgi:hypothetical protein
MNFRIALFILSLCIATSIEAAMVRVIAVEDGRTLVIEKTSATAQPARERIHLAGIALVDEPAARALLQWTLASNAWVLVEEQPGGGHLVYRSPDAMFLNRELVLRGYARATLPGIEPESHVPVTYLGTYNPATLPTAVPPRAARGVRSGSATGSGSGSGPRSRARPSPPRRRR